MNKKSMRLPSFIVAAAILLTPLTGCASKGRGRGDISDYVKDKIGLDDFSVSLFPQKSNDEESQMISNVWTVTDKDSGLEFHVVDFRFDEGDGGFGSLNEIMDDYSQQFINRNIEKLPELDGFSYGKMHNDERAHDHLYAYGVLNGEIDATFKTKSDLLDFENKLEQLRTAIEELDVTKPPYIEVLLSYENEYLDRTVSCATRVNIWDKFDSTEIMGDYVRLLYELRFDEEQMNEFSRDEVIKYLNSAKTSASGSGINFVGVHHNGRDKPADFYDDIIYMRRGELYISFGSIYEIIEREGIKTEGTPFHFKFKGKDGSEYEMSYEFFDVEKLEDTYSTEEYKKWYYILDGQKVSIDKTSYFGLPCDTLEEITGIQFADSDEVAANRESKKTN